MQGEVREVAAFFVVLLASLDHNPRPQKVAGQREVEQERRSSRRWSGEMDAERRLRMRVWLGEGRVAVVMEWLEDRWPVTGPLGATGASGVVR